jgi:hypothetical protein
MPGNPGHRKAKSFTVTIAYCLRHRLEATVFPTAQHQGWPTDIDFAKLFDRALLLRKHLQRLLDHNIIRYNEFYMDEMRSFAPGTSTAAASSAAAQFASFKGHGAG